MTDKKEKILESALELFAREGFKATSTNKVAKNAGVSEGLIFRHFNNKDGLLEAILALGEDRTKLLLADILMETEPKEVLRKTMALGEKMSHKKEDNEFWKLQYKIKWELEYYAQQKIEPLERALATAFEKLGYQEAELEAHLFLLTLDGMATRMYLQEGYQMEPILSYLCKKYDL